MSMCGGIGGGRLVKTHSAINDENPVTSIEGTPKFMVVRVYMDEHIDTGTCVNGCVEPLQPKKLSDVQSMSPNSMF